MLAQNGNVLLFNSDGLSNPYEPVKIEYFQYNLGKYKLTPLNYSIPRRVSCGEVQKDTTKVTDRIDNQYVYAIRSDRCGEFTARFDWTKAGNVLPRIDSVP